MLKVSRRRLSFGDLSLNEAWQAVSSHFEG